jgi:hypothetical protein
MQRGVSGWRQCVPCQCLIVLGVLQGSSQSSSQLGLGARVAGASRLEITPALIRAGESFTISLEHLTPQERNLSSITVSLSSSKLNEDVRLITLSPGILAPSSIDARRGPPATQIVQMFSARVSTVRCDAASRSDLPAVNVVPGTRLDAAYLPAFGASRASPDATVTLALGDVGAVQVALEPSIVLPPFATPG